MIPQILINNPGDGEWIALRAGGAFNPATDHSIGVHWAGVMKGGVVFSGYLGGAITIHMAGSEDNWATRDFLWMVYDYAFNQLGVRKLIGLVAETNTRALAIDLRMGFVVETRICDVMADGTDMLILTMRREQAKWLKVKPRYYACRKEQIHGQ